MPVTRNGSSGNLWGPGGPRGAGRGDADSAVDSGPGAGDQVRAIRLKRKRTRVQEVLVDGVCLAALVVVAGLALAPAYGGHTWLIALVAGAAIGTASVAIPALLRWPGATAVPLALVGYWVFGAAAAAPATATAGVIPTGATARLLLHAPVSGWKQLLTVTAPVGSGGALLVPAFLLAILASAAALALALHSPRPVWALTPPMIIMAVAALFGTDAAYLPIVTGAVVAIGGLAWGAWQRGGFRSGGIDLHRPVALLTLLLVMAGAGVALPWALAGSPDGSADRLALRDMVQPTFDPQTYPSPLAAFRQYVKADADTPMLTVTDLPDAARIRLAALDLYDGIEYAVSDAAGEFVGVGDIVPSSAEGTPVQVSFAIDGYRGVWLPDVGELSRVDFGGARAAELEQSLRYSQAASAATVALGLQEGDTYRLTAIMPHRPSPDELREAGPGNASVGEVGRVPSALTTLAATVTETADTPYDAVEAIRAAVATRGLLNHGDRPGLPSGHGYDRLAWLLDQGDMVGDQEQFAPLMALMVRSLGIPARVVVGFVPGGAGEDGSAGGASGGSAGGSSEVTVYGSDLSAWVEVNFAGYGWIPFDPTPGETRDVDEQLEEPLAAPHQLALQPPPPPRSSDDEAASEVADSDAESTPEAEDEQEAADAKNTPWILVTAVASPVALVVLALGFIVLLKFLRKRRHTQGLPARKVSGGWEYLVDAAIDLGAEVPEPLTRSEKAKLIEQTFRVPAEPLAATADTKVFGPADPAAAEATEYWQAVAGTVKQLRRSVSWWRRVRARLSLASLRRRKNGHFTYGRAARA